MNARIGTVSAPFCGHCTGSRESAPYPKPTSPQRRTHKEVNLKSAAHNDARAHTHSPYFDIVSPHYSVRVCVCTYIWQSTSVRVAGCVVIVSPIARAQFSRLTINGLAGCATLGSASIMSIIPIINRGLHPNPVKKLTLPKPIQNSCNYANGHLCI